MVENMALGALKQGMKLWIVASDRLRATVASAREGMDDVVVEAREEYAQRGDVQARPEVEHAAGVSAPAQAAEATPTRGKRAKHAPVTDAVHDPDVAGEADVAVGTDVAVAGETAVGAGVGAAVAGPVGAAVGGAAVAGVSDTPDDEAKGTAAGAAVGGTVGAAVGGPVGAVAGAALGGAAGAAVTDSDAPGEGEKKRRASRRSSSSESGEVISPPEA